MGTILGLALALPWLRFEPGQVYDVTSWVIPLRARPLSAVTLVEGTHARWTTALPRGLGAALAAQVDCLEGPRRDPACGNPERRLEGHRAFMGLRRLAGALVVAMRGGLLVLDERSGRLLIERHHEGHDPFAYGHDGYFVDRGDYRVEGTPCAGPSAQGKVFVECAGELLWFDGETAARVAPHPWRISGAGHLGGRADEGSVPGAPRVTIRVGDWLLRLSGIIYEH